MDSYRKKILDVALLTPSKRAIRINNNFWTYSDLADLVRKYDQELSCLGIGSSSRVALIGDSIPEIVCFFLSLQGVGATTYLISPHTQEREVDQITVEANVDWVIDQSNDFKPYAITRNNSDISLGTSEKPTIVFFTSGSSGTPKGVQITTRNMWSTLCSILKYLPLTNDEVVVSFSTIASDFGFYNILIPLCVGATAAYVNPYQSPSNILLQLKNVKASALHAFPPILEKLCRSDRTTKRLNTVSYICTSGQKLRRSSIIEVKKLFPNASLFLNYGLTECKRVLSLDPSQLPRRMESVGKPIPGVEVSLMDESNRVIREPFSIGELWVKSDQVMKGYLDPTIPSKTCLDKHPIDGEIWLNTGDLFYFDEGGYYYFLSRKSDLIQVDGRKVPIKNIEEKLMSSKLFTESIVINLGSFEKPKLIAAVTTKYKSERGLLDLANSLLSKVGALSSILTYQEIPKTPSGKFDLKKIELDAEIR